MSCPSEETGVAPGYPNDIIEDIPLPKVETEESQMWMSPSWVAEAKETMRQMGGITSDNPPQKRRRVLAIRFAGRRK